MEPTRVDPTAAAAPIAKSPAPRRVATRPRPAKKARPAAKRPARRKPSSSKPGPDLWTNLVAGRASRAGARISQLSKDGAASARKAFQDVKGLSKKTARRLSRDWQKMDKKRRIQLVATLVAALGAAAAPVLRRAFKK